MSKLSIPVSDQDHTQGDASAPCTLVEYGDYQCPSCGQAYPIVKKLQKHFGAKLLFVFRNFPLSQVHPWAEPAAEAAEFAGQHGKFWEMHDLLYENQDGLGEELFSELAGKLGFAPQQLQTAIAEHANHAHIRADFTGGVRSGVNGTPTFFINGTRYDDSYDFDSLSQAIDEVVKSAPKAHK
jgi:protein-disulfide isomerase